MCKGSQVWDFAQQQSAWCVLPQPVCICTTENLLQPLSSGPAQDGHVQFSCLRNLPAAALLNLNSAVLTCGRRYPSGESYMDVIQRLEPVIIEVERQKDSVCIVGHQAILRVIVGEHLV